MVLLGVFSAALGHVGLGHNRVALQLADHIARVKRKPQLRPLQGGLRKPCGEQLVGKIDCADRDQENCQQSDPHAPRQVGDTRCECFRIFCNGRHALALRCSAPPFKRPSLGLSGLPHQRAEKRLPIGGSHLRIHRTLGMGHHAQNPAVG